MSAADGSPSRWSWRGLVRAFLVTAAGFGVGALLGYLVSHERPPQQATAAPPAPSAARPHASDLELAIIAPLREGGVLGGFEVVEIDPIGTDGALRITCRKQSSVVHLDVALGVDGGPPPPAVAGRYSVFYRVEQAAPAEGERLSLALAAILQNNAAAPPPPGLAPFNAMPH